MSESKTPFDCLGLVADIRHALGDNGKRMQPELIEYCRQLVADRAELVESARGLLHVLGQSAENGYDPFAAEPFVDRLRALLARIEG
jgi:hypothetical protein